MNGCAGVEGVRRRRGEERWEEGVRELNCEAT